jgi:8-oxo-dGTP pyrophosphatase MutT (NUDIX family)
MSWERIRPLVLGIPRRDGEILVARLYDDSAKEPFYRPIGGGIKFGEASTEALVREFREELGVEVTVADYLGTVENMFTFEGADGHEIAIVHEVDPVDALARQGSVEGIDDGGATYAAEWHTPSALERADEPLYPEGLITLLTGDVAHVPPSD